MTFDEMCAFVRTHADADSIDAPTSSLTVYARMAYNDILARGFDGHHFISGLASHFRDVLVAKTPATLTLLEAGEAAQKMYGMQSQKTSQEFLLEGIDLANECDLRYKASHNQRLLVELCLMQLASITYDGEKKKLTGL